MNRQFRSIFYIFFYYVVSLLLMLLIHYFVLSQDRIEQSKQATLELFYDIEQEEKFQDTNNLTVNQIIARHPILSTRSYQLLLVDSKGMTNIAENRLSGDEAISFSLPTHFTHTNTNTKAQEFSNYKTYKDHMQGWVKLKDDYELSVTIFYKPPHSTPLSINLWIPYLFVALMIPIALFQFINRMRLWNKTIDYANNLATPNRKSRKYNTYKPLTYSDPIIGQEFARLSHALSRANYQLHYDQRQLDTLFKRLERLVEHAPLPVAFMQRNGRLNFVNNRFGYVFMTATNDRALKITDLLKGVDENTQHILDNLETQKIIQSIHVKSIQQTKTYQLHLMPWFSAHGQVQGFTAMLSDISQIDDKLHSTLSQINHQAARLSDYDKLWSVIGHELRTPLSGIIGMLELLNSTNLNQEQQETFETLEQTSQTMLYMLNDMLDLAKMDAGKLQLNIAKIDVLQICTQVCDLMVSNARRQGIELVLYIDPQTTGKILTDEARLRQVLLNLLGNAIKFTKSGYVALKVSTIYPNQLIPNKQDDTDEQELQDNAKPQLCFEIIDTGIGISAEEQRELFSYFNQANNTISPNFGGTGLGLAISKNFVKMLDGKIQVESEVNQGSTFTVTLPISAKNISPIYQYRSDFSQTYLLIAITQHDITNEHLTKLAQHIGLASIIKTGLSEQTILEINQHIAQQRTNGKNNQTVVLLVDYEVIPQNDISLLTTLANFDNTAKLLWSMTPESAIDHLFISQFDGYVAKPLDTSHFVSEIMRVSQRSDEEGELRKVSKLQYSFNQFLDNMEAYATQEAAHEQAPALDENISANKNSTKQPNLSQLILVAEDNPVNLKVVTKILQKLGYQSISATNGEEALEILAERRAEISMIFMDCRMPIMDGLTATKKIRKSGDSIPIIALTANDTDEDRALCLHVGMNDFLAKPIKKSTLQSMLSTYLVKK